jgi:hypothetical integral membrane protein (TIGR02206 family)
MQQFFAYYYTGESFHLFGVPHLAALGVLLLLILSLRPYKHAPEQTRRRIRITMGVILWLNESTWHLWNAVHGHWTLQTMLPLHACSLLIWLAGFMLIFNSYRIYEFVYFMGIGGAFQYLMTPDLGIYGFPHFRYFQTFTSHGLLLTAGLYITIVEGFRPTWSSMLRVILVMNIYMAIIYPINVLLGSNYLMINGKPATASLLDVFPPWPVYILYMEAIGLITFILLYTPFLIRDWQDKALAAREGSSRLERISK